MFSWFISLDLDITVCFGGIVLGLLKESALEVGAHFEEKGLAEGQGTVRGKNCVGRLEPQAVRSWQGPGSSNSGSLTSHWGRGRKWGLRVKLPLDRGPEPEMRVWPKVTGSPEDLLGFLFRNLLSHFQCWQHRPGTPRAPGNLFAGENHIHWYLGVFSYTPTESH